jgi:hypothetical protein
MKKNKCFVLGMLVVVLTFGLVFGGCSSMASAIAGQKMESYEEENENSQAIFKAASDLVLAKDNGINCDAFIASMKGQLQGLEVTQDAGGNSIGTPWITFKYKDKSYHLEFTQRITEESRGLGKGKIYYITSITSCKEKGYRPVAQ